jgi:hypothetical protein
MLVAHEPERGPMSLADHVPPNSIDAILVSLTEMSPAGYAKFRAAVTGLEAFDDAQDRVDKLSVEVGLPKKNVHGLLNVLNQIYKIAHGNDNDTDQAVAEVGDLVLSLEHVKRGTELNKKIIERIQPLLVKNASVEQAAKIAKIKRGYTRNAVSFDTLVELRPEFDSERAVLLSLIPAIQFQIRTDATSVSDRDIVFQLDAEALSDLAEVIDYPSVNGGVEKFD